MAEPLVSDALWALIAPLLPEWRPSRASVSCTPTRTRSPARRRDQVFGDPIAEILLPRVAALVGERQDGDDGIGRRRALLVMLPNETATRKPEGYGDAGEQEEDRRDEPDPPGTHQRPPRRLWNGDWARPV